MFEIDARVGKRRAGASQYRRGSLTPVVVVHEIK